MPCRRGTGRATTSPRLVPTISKPWQTSRLVTDSRWCPAGQTRRAWGPGARCQRPLWNHGGPGLRAHTNGTLPGSRATGAQAMVALPSAGRGRPGQGVGGESWDGPLADTQLGGRPLCLLSSGAPGCTHMHTCTHTCTQRHTCAQLLVLCQQETRSPARQSRDKARLSLCGSTFGRWPFIPQTCVPFARRNE